MNKKSIGKFVAFFMALVLCCGTILPTYAFAQELPTASVENTTDEGISTYAHADLVYPTQTTFTTTGTLTEVRYTGNVYKPFGWNGTVRLRFTNSQGGYLIYTFTIDAGTYRADVELPPNTYTITEESRTCSAIQQLTLNFS